MRYESGAALLRHPEFPRDKLTDLYADERLQREAVITDANTAVAVCRFDVRSDESILLKTVFLHEDVTAAVRILGYISEQLTRRYQPKRILVEEPSSFMIRVLQSSVPCCRS